MRDDTFSLNDSLSTIIKKCIESYGNKLILVDDNNMVKWVLTFKDLF